MNSIDLEPKVSLPNRQSYIVFGIVAAAFLTASINTTIVAVALPRMLEELHTSLAWVGWTLTGFLLAQSITMPLAGKLSDEWGARRILLASVALFTIGSLLGAVAPNVYVLIFARMLQAVGAGAQMPSATSIVSDAFGDRRATFIGLFTTIFPIGGVLGPTIGGFVIDNYSWRWMFYGCVPIGVVILVAGILLIPRGRSMGSGRRLDLIGAGIFAFSLVAILSAMTAWGNDAESVRNPLTWLVVVLGVVAMAVFVWHEGRTPSPVIDLELLRARPFIAANVFNFLYGAVVFSFSLFIPYYATIAYGMSAGESGVVMGPRSAAMVIASTASSIFLIRLGYRLPMILGMVLNAGSLILVSQGYHDLSLFGWPVPNFVLLSSMVLLAGAAHGTSAPPANNASLDLVPGKVAAVVGLRGMFRSAGGVFSTAAIILAASNIEDKAAGMQAIFLALGLISLLAVLVVFLIPDSARQRYLAARNERGRRTTSAAE
ncbi:MAG: MFS transporter [Dehalococcoidia bacterium]|nr:MFS transporter [Dehalococcoidia bacterium]